MTEPMFADVSKTVTVIRRVANGRNAHGNTIWSEVRTDLPGCLVAWGTTTEESDNASRTIDTATVYDISRQWPADAQGRVEIDGLSWEVDGTPQDWPGAIGGIVVNLRKVSG